MGDARKHAAGPLAGSPGALEDRIARMAWDRFAPEHETSFDECIHKNEYARFGRDVTALQLANVAHAMWASAEDECEHLRAVNAELLAVLKRAQPIITRLAEQQRQERGRSMEGPDCNTGEYLLHLDIKASLAKASGEV